MTYQKPKLATILKQEMDHANISIEAFRKALGAETTEVAQAVLDRKMLFPIRATITVAKLLNLDPVDVLRIALGETSPELLKVLDEITTKGLFMSRSELSAVMHFRDAMREP